MLYFPSDREVSWVRRKIPLIVPSHGRVIGEAHVPAIPDFGREGVDIVAIMYTRHLPFLQNAEWVAKLIKEGVSANLGYSFSGLIYLGSCIEVFTSANKQIQRPVYRYIGNPMPPEN